MPAPPNLGTSRDLGLLGFWLAVAGSVVPLIGLLAAVGGFALGVVGLNVQRRSGGDRRWPIAAIASGVVVAVASVAFTVYFAQLTYYFFASDSD